MMLQKYDTLRLWQNKKGNFVRSCLLGVRKPYGYVCM